ncbi:MULTISPECIES: hypothetical protein [unclassified Tolypothrix]|uniref:hypothetical protein n=1 Tax=unclassified Tolypothrix TaxID=2649714 RepID=UPI0005EAB34C|nr:MULTISPECIES: hypothetical protein [unclassified Tolypothrix]BAY90670.1 hypothetical protein NIES3275_26870 [Microchaete diplosiphon NIES-3275]EKF01525.1 hypothetical protein FDUTEX481_07867 [Tolypothrix sp. PCC 7601]MBE9082618.1 hypothetical protein [Tolypothrix sp. LEGE 11397]UYD24819.1 hypothetical protein HGR01_25840 [Tolypothrix sp. PCC 7712]UYD32949.1 hypothetical protein HG267_28800 [Tolypothrix sp. PCC 7601]
MPETKIQQSPTSLSSLPVLYTRDAAQPIQYNPFQEITQLFQTLFEEDTSSVYQKAGAKTWKIVKQIITVVTFLFLLLCALIIWVWGIGFKSGLYFRTWIETKKPSIDELIVAILKIILWPLERTFEWANSFIKDLFGWEIKFDESKAEPNSTTAGGEATPSPASSQSSQTS